VRCSERPWAEERNCSERWALIDFALAAVFIASALPKYWFEKRGDIEFSKRAGGFDLRNFFSLGFQEGFGAVILVTTGSSDNSSSTGFFDHFLVDHLTQFETISAPERSPFEPARREDLLLREPEVKFWRQPVHGVSSTGNDRRDTLGGLRNYC